MEPKFNKGKSRQIRLVAFLLLSIISIQYFTTKSAVAGYLEADPEIGEWQNFFCNTGNYVIDSVAHCVAAGGTWHGANASPSCSGHDEGFRFLPIEEQVRKFSKSRYNVCGEPNVSFSGWGNPVHSEYQCWHSGVEYKYGVENRNTGNLTVTGTTGPPSCDLAVNEQMSALRTRDVICPVGTSARDEGNGQRCYKFCPEGQILVNGLCDNPPEKSPCDAPGENYTNNPCNVATGNKYRAETDLSDNALGFTRFYNSSFLYTTDYGVGWRSNYQKEIIKVSANSLVLVSSSGRGDPWQKINGVWQGDSDTKVTLTETATGYRVMLPNTAYDDYNSNGQLVSQTNINGHQTTLSYNSDGRLASVTNQYGEVLAFAYTAGRLNSVTDALGTVIEYKYDLNKNLERVIYPDNTPASNADNPTKIYHYENAIFPNHLTGITDENGDRYGTFAYNSEGKAISSELAVTSNPVGQEHIDLSYNTGNTVVTDAAGTQEVWVFDEILNANKLVSKTNQSDGKAMSQTWDANGNKLSRTDAEGRVTSYTYNVHNQKTSMTEASGSPDARTTTYEYVSADIDLVTKTMTPSIYSGHTKEVINSYDANQNITSVVTNGFNATGVAVTRATTFQYDAYGKVTQIDGPRTDVNDITALEYYDCNTGSECGQLKKVTNAAGHVTTYDDYDAVARLLQSTDANGVVTTYIYNPRGWLLSMTQTPPTGTARVTTYENDNVGQVIKTTLPDGAEQHYVYDAAHALREISDNLGNKITYLYDAKGNRTQEQIFDPDGTLVRNTTTTYNARNFIESVNSGGSVTQIVNDAVGNISTQTDPNANPATQHSFDGLDRLKNTVDALGNTSSYDYDVDDRLAQVTAPNTAQTSYVYDDLGNLLSETSPDRGVLSYVHDAAGNVVSSTDARGVVTTNSYDVLNRLINIDYNGTAEDVTYTYDSPVNASDDCGYGVGRLCEVTDNGGLKRFQYDAFGNAVEVEHSISGLSFVWQYQYGLANRVLAVTYPSGRQITIARDAIGRLTDMSTTVELVQTQVVSNRSYQGDGLKKEHLLGNGLWSTQSYDQQGRLIAQSNADPTPKSYQYDANGNIVDLTANAGQRLFTYDVLDRLTAANQPTTDHVYTYDANGNRLSTGINQQTTNLSYQANSNRLNQVGAATLNLDATGNTISDQGGNRTFDYNQAGRLSRIVENGAEVARYEYDSNGLRTKKITPTGTTVYLYGFDGQLRMESDDNGIANKEYLYADGELVAVIVREEGTPHITVPNDITVEAADANPQAVALGNATAVDENGNTFVVTVDNTGPFPLGETIVTWSATGTTGAIGVATQRISVVDTTPPVLAVPADVSVDSQIARVVEIGSATASDAFTVTITNDAPLLFPIGITVVTWTATDANNNSSVATQTVTVLEVIEHCVSTTNVAIDGTASQSSDFSNYYVAAKGNNGINSDVTATASIDNNASWQLDLADLKQIEQVILHNRDDAAQARLRDITVLIEDDAGATVYQSPLLNPENTLSGPDSISVNVGGRAGSRLIVRRTPDPDHSGGGSSVSDSNILSLGEVEILGCAPPAGPTAPMLHDLGYLSSYTDSPVSHQVSAFDVNGDVLTFSATGLPNGLTIDSSTGLITGVATQAGNSMAEIMVADGLFTASASLNLQVVESSERCALTSNIASTGTASQSSDFSYYYKAFKGNNGITSDVTATASTDSNASWSLEFSDVKQIEQIILHNRDDAAEARLRDVTVLIEDAAGAIVYQSPLLNPENILSGPDNIVIDVAGALGRKLIVKRTPDPDHSGGGSSVSDSNLLSLGEVETQGCAVQGGQ